MALKKTQTLFCDNYKGFIRLITIYSYIINYIQELVILSCYFSENALNKAVGSHVNQSIITGETFLIFYILFQPLTFILEEYDTVDSRSVAKSSLNGLHAINNYLHNG